MDLTLEMIQSLAKVLVENKLDRLKFGDFEIVKTKHEVEKTDKPQSNKNASVLDEEEILYWSTSAPALTPEQVEMLSANPMPKPRKSKKDKDS